jgi:hypothetical protein
MYFDNEFDYYHDQIFTKPKRDFDTALAPHKAEYLSHHTDAEHDSVVWPTDARGVEFLKAVNASDRKHGVGGMAAKETDPLDYTDRKDDNNQ